MVHSNVDHIDFWIGKMKLAPETKQRMKLKDLEIDAKTIGMQNGSTGTQTRTMAERATVLLCHVQCMDGK